LQELVELHHFELFFLVSTNRFWQYGLVSDNIDMFHCDIDLASLLLYDVLLVVVVVIVV
jgi:hypothetical protein